MTNMIGPGGPQTRRAFFRTTGLGLAPIALRSLTEAEQILFLGLASPP